MMWRTDWSRRVLVAACDRATRAALLELLTDAGFAVRVCGDVREAAAALESFRPHLVLADIDLPGGGIARLRQCLRQLAPDARLAILTALLDVDARRRTADLRVDAYLNRPLSLGRALRIVRYLTAAGTAPSAA